VSAAAVGGLDALAATGASGAEPIAATAARVQQLQALIAEVEHHSPATSFASALSAAADAEDASAASGTASIAAAPAASGTAGTAAAPAASGTAGTAAPPAASGTGAGTAYAPLIEQAAARYGLDPAVLYGLIQQESGFDPSARSSAGALGLTQLMPSTAASLGVAEPLDPAQSIEGGARYLSQLLGQFAGNTADALAAYNAGPGAVQQYGGVPPFPETQQYVTKVLGYAAAYHPGIGSSPSALYTAAAPSPGYLAGAGASEAIA
jgi:soluble lytic murein transglycosylase-like protein